VLGAVMAALQTNAQGLEMFDPIKETNFMHNSPEMNLVFKSGVGVEEEKIAGNWVKTNRMTGTQDAKGNQTAFGNEFWDTTTNVWMVDGFLTNKLTYDANGKVSSNYLVIVSEGEKVMSRTFTYTYDGAGKYLPVRSIDSVFGTTPLVYNSTDSIVYNMEGKIAERIESMNLMGMNILKSRKSYTYDANGNILEVLVEEHNGSAWEDQQRFTMTFNAGNKILAKMTEDFDGNVWETSELDSFTYDASNILATHAQYFNNNGNLALENHSTYAYTGTQVSQILEKNWNGVALENENKIALNYNNGALETVYFYKWLGSAYETEHSSRITFSGAVGLKSVVAHSFSMYPNPAVSQINLTGITQSASLSIIDLNGKVWLNQNIDAVNSSIAIDELVSGIYLVQIKVGEQVISKRLIKE